MLEVASLLRFTVAVAVGMPATGGSRTPYLLKFHAPSFRPNTCHQTRWIIRSCPSISK